MPDDWLAQLTEAVKLDISTVSGAVAFRQLLRSSWKGAPRRIRPIIGKMQTMFRGKSEVKAQTHAKLQELVSRRGRLAAKKRRLAGEPSQRAAEAAAAATSSHAGHASIAIAPGSLDGGVEPEDEDGDDEDEEAADQRGGSPEAGSTGARIKAEPNSPKAETKSIHVKKKVGAKLRSKPKSLKSEVKKELGGKNGKNVKIKKELSDTIGGKSGFAKGIKHYCYQLACVNSIVPSPWKLCFGAFGSGIIGVRPETSEVKEERVKQERKEDKVKKELEEEEDDNAESVPALPVDSTVILLINAATSPMMSRNGHIVGSYTESLDIENACLRWSSQRRDKNNRVILAIVAHCLRGGRIVVVARNGQTEEGRTFKLLGEVSHIDEVRKSSFLVQDGDQILLERGNNLYHRQIGVTCLNQGLKSGVGLAAARYPLKQQKAVRWCASCCFQPPSALLHFKELMPEGVALYGVTPQVKPSDKDGAEVTAVRPAKRLRSKQAIESASAGAQESLPSPVPSLEDEMPVLVKRELEGVTGM